MKNFIMILLIFCGIGCNNLNNGHSNLPSNKDLENFALIGSISKPPTVQIVNSSSIAQSYSLWDNSACIAYPSQGDYVVFDFGTVQPGQTSTKATIPIGGAGMGTGWLFFRVNSTCNVKNTNGVIDPPLPYYITNIFGQSNTLCTVTSTDGSQFSCIRTN